VIEGGDLQLLGHAIGVPRVVVGLQIEPKPRAVAEARLRRAAISTVTGRFLS
jgi:hypothetical protein